MSLFRNVSTSGILASIGFLLASVLSGSTSLVAAQGAVQASQSPTEAKELHVFLLMGQSNMAGYGQTEPGDEQAVADVFVLGGECDKRSAKPLTPIEWRPASHPLHSVLSTDRFGLGLPFAEAYLQSHPGVQVGLVPCAWGGANIDGIGPGSPTWENAVARAREAMSSGTIMGILWHQGESDTIDSDRAAAYAGKLDALVVAAREELRDAELPFIVGNLAPFYGTGPDHNAPERVRQIEQVRHALRTLPRRMEHTAFVSAVGTSSPDHHMVHFDRASYISLGQQYALAYDMLGLPELGRADKATVDYLIDASPFEARVGKAADGQELILDNGLVRRTWRVAPNGACIGYDNLMNGQAMLRAVRPEARVTIDGVAYDVGGLTGQPNHAFLKPEWIAGMEADIRAMRLVGVEFGEPVERLAWGRRRHSAPGATWPPEGVSLRMDYAMPPLDDSQVEAMLISGVAADTTGRMDEGAPGYAPPSELGRATLLEDEFESLDAWEIHTSDTHERSTFMNEGKPGEIYTYANTATFAERKLPGGTRSVEATIDVGTDQSASWGPGIALVFEKRVIKFNIRPNGDQNGNKPLLGLWDGRTEHSNLGGQSPLDTTKPWTLRLRITGNVVFCDAKSEGGEWGNYGQTALQDAGDPRAVRVGKMDVRGAGGDFGEPGEMVRLTVRRFAAYSGVDTESLAALDTQMAESRQVRVSVHYELYDGIPVMSKWLTIHNDSGREITIDRFTGEELALVEHSNWVESRQGAVIPPPDYLHVETDFAFGGFHHKNANRHAVHWRPDTLYTSQVNWARKTPCLLVCEPTYGPAQRVAPGEAFEGFRVFELAYDSTDRDRRGLALKQMYRTVAPWVTENPITHHLLTNSAERVLAAIDEALDVGFEAIILSFGSGFNMENRDPVFLGKWKEVANYAEEKGIELGCYSLFSSRGVGGDNMIVSPEGERPTHGQCPAVTSTWGQQWLRTIKEFYAVTGFDQFENDGPYPGDVDTTPRPPLQAGVQDSRWTQWRMTSGLYRELREAGVYINAPDYYYLSGSNKCGMGYREVNWSLPREHQVIHTRQNIYDGSWTKTPSMGWMFVPLSQYHGGGAAATIEPLSQHLAHYERMLQSNLGMGVQAHYRGPRLFDTDVTRGMVKSVVDWFKTYRDILESDFIHGRRADGRDLDWILHVNPRLSDKGMLCVYNPLDQDVTRTLRVDLYYTGLTDIVHVSASGNEASVHKLDRDYGVELQVTVPAGGMSWYVIRAD
ncbi:MAG: hypothetical protein ACI8PQ_000811 [Planctomycetota bacterium]|jgi:hypothetical protein